MEVVVRKSSLEVVRPPPELARSADSTNLSPYDKQVMSMPVTMFLAFDRPIQQPAESIKRSLSKALLHYLPMSGRVDAAGVRITRTGEGVWFVAGSARCALEDVKLSAQLVDQLAIYYPAEYCGLDDPLVMMQVTEFSCGGFVVGVTWNHVIADAAGIGQFLQAVGELARGLPSPSVVPVRRDDSLMTSVPPCIDGLGELMMGVRPVEMAILDITVPSSTIQRIKEEYRVYSNGSRPCSTFEAVTALLWQCRTRAMTPAVEEETVAMYITVNARKYVAARDGYYGNCVTGRLVVATGKAVANAHLTGLVEMIQCAKSQVAEHYKKDATVQRVGSLAGYNLLLVSCWRNLGLDEVDFGGGRPVQVTSYMPQRMRLPVCLPCLPCQRTHHGSNVLSACVTKDHAGAFLQQLSSSFN